MTKLKLLLLAMLSIAAFTPTLRSAEEWANNFDPSVVSGANGTTNVVATQPTELNRTDDNMMVRNCLVIIGLGITFCVGMAITATTIHQNRPTTPQPTRFYAS